MPTPALIPLILTPALAADDSGGDSSADSDDDSSDDNSGDDSDADSAENSGAVSGTDSTDESGDEHGDDPIANTNETHDRVPGEARDAGHASAENRNACRKNHV